MRHRRAWAGAIVAIALVLSTVAPAAAHGRVFIGGGFGYPPVYGYPHPYYYYPYPYVAPYPGIDYAPPPGWVPGHSEWRYDRWGRRYQAWVPGHLR